MDIIKKNDSIIIGNSSKLVEMFTEHFGIIIDPTATTDDICKEVKEFIVKMQIAYGLTDQQMVDACDSSNMQNANTYRQLCKMFDKQPYQKRGINLGVVINLSKRFNVSTNATKIEEGSAQSLNNLIKFKLNYEEYIGNIIGIVNAGDSSWKITKKKLGNSLFSSMSKTRLTLGEDTVNFDRYIVCYKKDTRLKYYAVIPVTDVISEDLK